ncbi:MAG: Holliday junction branch migration DNA helicase RuvB [Candidatus Caenarcaniphilales bacterium]|nr:Holliday junction branch migration DNA helicase RuvB [Candidatus Caenarcaniphilales bacterium]
MSPPIERFVINAVEPEISDQRHSKSISKKTSPKRALANPEATKNDQALESSLRPQGLDEYIGQDRLKQILRIGIEAAYKRGDKTSLGHVLLYGAPGLGKTTCAYILASLIGSKAHIFSAPALDKPKDIVGVLLSLQAGDVLFIDEIHRLTKVSEELLYSAMEDYVLDLSTGKGVSARMSRLSLSRFILLGATTKLGNIASPLRDRFTQIYRMEFYSPEELAQIAQRTAKILNFNLDQDGSLTIARRGRGTPRIINRLCRLVRDYLSHKDQKVATRELVEEALDLFQIDATGLDQTDREILRIIIEHHRGGPVGLETLAVSLGEDSKTLEDYYEPYLVQCGLLERTPKGRKASPKAFEYLGHESTESQTILRL